MKIAIIIPVLDLGGAETMCENLAYSLEKYGNQVLIVSLYTRETAITSRLIKKGVQVVFLDKKSGFDGLLFIRLAKLLKREKVDVVHTHIYSIKYGIIAAILAGVKTRVHTVHNVAEKEAGKSARKLNAFFFKYCKVVPVALSELVQASIEKEYAIPKESIPVAYNGIDLSNCIKKGSYSFDGEFVILNIARFFEQKNHAGLIEAFAKFNKKYPKSRLWLIGDGELKDDIINRVKNENLTDKVDFLGLKSDVYPYLNRADAFVLSSNYEGIPMTLIEAMGTGLPIVATCVGGIPDMLTDEESALIKKVSSDAIAEGLERIFLSDKLREYLGNNAMTESIRFSADTMAKNYLNIYIKRESNIQRGGFG